MITKILNLRYSFNKFSILVSSDWWNKPSLFANIKVDLESMGFDLCLTVSELLSNEVKSLLIWRNSLLFSNFLLEISYSLSFFKIDYHCPSSESSGKDLHASSESENQTESWFFLNVVVSFIFILLFEFAAKGLESALEFVEIITNSLGESREPLIFYLILFLFSMSTESIVRGSYVLNAYPVMLKLMFLMSNHLSWRYTKNTKNDVIKLSTGSLLKSTLSM